jgi:hypothetical protein
MACRAWPLLSKARPGRSDTKSRLGGWGDDSSLFIWILPFAAAWKIFARLPSAIRIHVTGFFIVSVRSFVEGLGWSSDHNICVPAAVTQINVPVRRRA